MELTKVYAAYFSPTHTTRRTVSHLANALASLLGAGAVAFDFTLPEGRVLPVQAKAGELWVVGLPVYAGRLPNLLLKYLAGWQADGALVLPVVLYGNRSYGNALVELHDLLSERGFLPVGAAAFVGQHSFVSTLATGRPDAADLALANGFAGEIAGRVRDYQGGKTLPRLTLKGEGAPDYGGYYQPLGESGEPVRFLKAKPETTDLCTGCGRCAAVCPMGSIDAMQPSLVTGICIKCNACIHACPRRAKVFTDDAYLSHVRFLKAHYTHPAPVELF